MSTTTEPSTTTIEHEHCCTNMISACIMSTAFAAFAALVILLIYMIKFEQPFPVKYLTVAVESTAVRYYNVTPDGRVESNIGVGIRAGNPDPDGPPLKLTNLRLYVKKGKQMIANSGRLPGVFNLTAGSEELVHGEASGLVPLPDPYSGEWHLDAKLIEEVRADLAAGEGIVRVILYGDLGKRLSLAATCEDVVIDCSGRSAVRAQKVDCQVIGFY